MLSRIQLLHPCPRGAMLFSSGVISYRDYDEDGEDDNILEMDDFGPFLTVNPGFVPWRDLVFLTGVQVEDLQSACKMTFDMIDLLGWHIGSETLSRR